MVTIFDTCKSHQETDATKRLCWRICYAILRGFCARRLVTWRPLSESFSSLSWYRIKDQRELLFSSMPQTFAEQGPECFAKYEAVQGLKGPILAAWIFMQSSTPGRLHAKCPQNIASRIPSLHTNIPIKQQSVILQFWEGHSQGSVTFQVHFPPLDTWRKNVFQN